MDMDAFKGNVKKALALMTPEMQLDLSRLFTMVEKHVPTIQKIGTPLWELIANDVMSLVFEMQTGMLNMDKLSEVMHAAFGEAGIVVPDAPKVPNAGPDAR